MTWLIFHKLGKIPSSKRLLKSFDNANDSGVDIRLINLPGIPQCDIFDFLSPLMIFATSIGEVFMLLTSVIFSSLSNIGTLSFSPTTLAFETKKLV